VSVVCFSTSRLLDSCAVTFFLSPHHPNTLSPRSHTPAALLLRYGHPGAAAGHHVTPRLEATTSLRREQKGEGAPRPREPSVSQALGQVVHSNGSNQHRSNWKCSQAVAVGHDDRW